VAVVVVVVAAVAVVAVITTTIIIVVLELAVRVQNVLYQDGRAVAVRAGTASLH
jgi:hypothetical protein